MAFEYGRLRGRRQIKERQEKYRDDHRVARTGVASFQSFQMTGVVIA
jgi:hypothetical protein